MQENISKKKKINVTVIKLKNMAVQKKEDISQINRRQKNKTNESH